MRRLLPAVWLLAACSSPSPEASRAARPAAPASTATAPLPEADRALLADLARVGGDAAAWAVARPDRLRALKPPFALPELPSSLDATRPVVVALGILESPGEADGLLVGAWSGLDDGFDGLRHEIWLPATDPAALAVALEPTLAKLGFTAIEEAPPKRWVRAPGYTIVMRDEPERLRVTVREPVLRPGGTSPAERAEEAAVHASEPPPLTPALHALLRPDTAAGVYARPERLTRLARWWVLRSAWAELTGSSEARAAALARVAGQVAARIAAGEPPAEIEDLSVRLSSGDGPPLLVAAASLTAAGERAWSAGDGPVPPVPSGAARALVRVGVSLRGLLGGVSAATAPATGPEALAAAARHPLALLQAALGPKAALPDTLTWALRPPSADAPGMGLRPVAAASLRAPEDADALGALLDAWMPGGERRVEARGGPSFLLWGAGGPAELEDEAPPLPAGAALVAEAVPARLAGPLDLPWLADVPPVSAELAHLGRALALRIAVGGPLPPRSDYGRLTWTTPDPAPGRGAGCLDHLRLQVAAAWGDDVSVGQRAEALRRLPVVAAEDLDCVASDPTTAPFAAGVRAELALMAADQLAAAWRPADAAALLRSACDAGDARGCRRLARVAVNPDVAVPVVPATCPPAPRTLAHRALLGTKGLVVDGVPIETGRGDISEAERHRIEAALARNHGAPGEAVGLAAGADVPYDRLWRTLEALRRAGAAAVVAIVRDAEGQPHLLGPLKLTDARPRPDGAPTARFDDDRLALRWGERLYGLRVPVCGHAGCTDATALREPVESLRHLAPTPDRTLYVEAGADSPWESVAQIAAAACGDLRLAPPASSAPRRRHEGK